MTPLSHLSPNSINTPSPGQQENLSVQFFLLNLQPVPSSPFPVLTL